MSVLFYSRKCPNCLELLKKLREEQMLEIFDELFLVDGRKQLPPWLTAVPTIIVPDSNKPLVGDDAFSWVTYKLNQKYKQEELGTLNSGGGDYVDLTKDPNDINLDTGDYISINNIDKPIKPNMEEQGKLYQNEGMDFQKRLNILEQERAQFNQNQTGTAPPQPNFQDPI